MINGVPQITETPALYHTFIVVLNDDGTIKYDADGREEAYSYGPSSTFTLDTGYDLATVRLLTKYDPGSLTVVENCSNAKCSSEDGMDSYYYNWVNGVEGYGLTNSNTAAFDTLVQGGYNYSSPPGAPGPTPGWGWGGLFTSFPWITLNDDGDTVVRLGDFTGAYGNVR
jgi:hypothetical protein